MITIIYDDYFRIEEVLLERRVEAQLQYLVRWAPHEIEAKHYKAFEELGYTGKMELMKPCKEGEGARCMVFWNDTWEPEGNVSDHEQGIRCIQLYEEQRMKQAKGNVRPRRDAALSNEARQGYWPAPEQKMIQPLALEPELAELISIDPLRPINPDLDIKPT